ncbi:hypothetical protein HBI56_102730 [Parastagonospora nodorum]|uniref:Uncharacterized protein n=1 Tax=Phaeosphaeria nodorum (strain SN15 / ATCC MYA-4574 / FGSC 10173) TaxID=321614 RepID=A0A7U2I3Z8_PHANO|nr:hypothetical protein HBH56_136130 [Parastagonospora nodorum]QRD02526.1 hypothetical protein JI435_112810 [Parastagonospora nodorum SN15]KAH3926949.1 hypothetical protein HBH54_157160 [Parastagonospora nodorum]KAH3949551.1 hypothetical protein HBH53_091290 [Parastagonospora nodorum]KAH3956512.1 hypothetical protein HBH51_240740 [Parastagonospora nodorum]
MSELHRIFDINVFGTIRVIKAMSDLLIESKGTIVNVGSLAAYSPYAFGAAYNGSKAALLAMGNTLRIELSPFNVKVMTVLSGPVESGLMTRATRVLPSSSLYLPVQAEFNSRMSHKEHGVKTLARGQFAKDVYTKVASPPMNFWIGPWSRVVWVLETFGLQSVWARIFTKTFRLDKLRRVKL